MNSQDKTITKKRGRPATGLGILIGVRFQPDDLAALDAFIEPLAGTMTRPMAVRLLVRAALAELNKPGRAISHDDGGFDVSLEASDGVSA